MAIATNRAAHGEPVRRKRQQRFNLRALQRASQGYGHSRTPAALGKMRNLGKREEIEQRPAILTPGIEQECTPPFDASERADLSGWRGFRALPVGVSDRDGTAGEG